MRDSAKDSVGLWLSFLFSRAQTQTFGHRHRRRRRLRHSDTPSSALPFAFAFSSSGSSSVLSYLHLLLLFSLSSRLFPSSSHSLIHQRQILSTPPPSCHPVTSPFATPIYPHPLTDPCLSHITSFRGMFLLAPLLYNSFIFLPP